MADQFKKAMADAFLAKVDSILETGFMITPLITEYQGTIHEPIQAISRDGVTPSVDDIVLVLTMRNNIDLTEISRYYGASESNPVIIGIMKTVADPAYVLKGNYNFIGDTLFTGNLSVTENITIEKDAIIKGDAVFEGDVTIEGNLFIGGINYKIHQHSPGTYSNGFGPVVGLSGGVL